MRDHSAAPRLPSGGIDLKDHPAQLEVGLAVYATQVMDLDARWLGVAFALNTVTIVVAQLFVLARLEGRSRSRALAAAALWDAPKLQATA